MIPRHDGFTFAETGQEIIRALAQANVAGRPVAAQFDVINRVLECLSYKQIITSHEARIVTLSNGTRILKLRWSTFTPNPSSLTSILIEYLTPDKLDLLEVMES